MRALTERQLNKKRAVSLYQLSQQRAEAGRPVRVGLIGAGKFGSMFLSQVPTIPGLEVVVIADLDPERARAACRKVGWDAVRIARTRFVPSGIELCADDAVEVVVEATGIPAAGIAHARAAIAAGKHIVMVNVEADVLAGPLLAQEARRKGIVYSLAYGDQPALTCELVDWARACGFRVAAAGKGTKYLPAYHQVTPDEVWGHYGLTPEEAQTGGMNPQMRPNEIMRRDPQPDGRGTGAGRLANMARRTAGHRRLRRFLLRRLLRTGDCRR